jgi:hypothetical protein
MTRLSDQPSAFERETMEEHDAWFRSQIVDDAAVWRRAWGWATKLWCKSKGKRDEKVA